MRIATSLLLIVAVICSVMFGMLNSQPININYYFGELQAPFSLVLAIALLVGVIIGALPGINVIVKTKRENKKLIRKIRLTEEEVINLRKIPIKDNN